MNQAASTDPFESFTLPTEHIGDLQAPVQFASEQVQSVPSLLDTFAVEAARPLSILQGYIGVFIIAFVITLLTTPIVRKLAVQNGIVDNPSEARKVHKMPIAYLGGIAVFFGILAGIIYSYFASEISGLIDFYPTEHLVDGMYQPMLSPWIAVGMTSIVLVGLIDDISGIAPRIKLGGQLVAAAALAVGDVGTNVAAGILRPTLGRLLDNPDLFYSIPIGFELPMGMGSSIPIDTTYWVGTAIIGIFVLGACNASNFIDGLDGLLTGVTSIALMGLVAVALMMAVADDGQFDGPRIVLGLAVLGACLGFLPHNFNPASIFLGDTGSLLLGYCSAVMILSLGDTGKTGLVFAGLVIYSIPIIDTALAIIRRKLAGKKMSDADADHLHHMLKRSFGVKGAVFILYGMGFVFCILGIAMSQFRARFIYALALLIASYIGVYAIKIARRSQIEEQAAASMKPKPDSSKTG